VSEWIQDKPGRAQANCPYPDCRQLFTFPENYQAPEILMCPYCKRKYVMLDPPILGEPKKVRTDVGR
jgi:hypothetical protein